MPKNTGLWAAKELNAVMTDPWALSPLNHPWWDLLQYNEESSIVLKTVGSQGVYNNKVQLDLEFWIDLWHVLSLTWTDLGELM